MSGFEVVEAASNNPKVAQARAMRKAPAASEALLWRLLRGGKLSGWKFRRQHPVGVYIVDFACLRHRLIVELDGPLHDEAADAERDAWIESQGFRILRFKNAALQNNREVVLAKILDAIG